jgi:hypothetical protein
MTFAFDPSQGLIRIAAALDGPGGITLLQLALDTGATDTAISVHLLRRSGYDSVLATTTVEVTTGSAVVHIPLLTVAKLSAAWSRSYCLFGSGTYLAAQCGR